MANACKEKCSVCFMWQLQLRIHLTCPGDSQSYTAVQMYNVVKWIVKHYFLLLLLTFFRSGNEKKKNLHAAKNPVFFPAYLKEPENSHKMVVIKTHVTGWMWHLQHIYDQLVNKLLAQWAHAVIGVWQRISQSCFVMPADCGDASWQNLFCWRIFLVQMTDLRPAVLPPGRPEVC